MHAAESSEGVVGVGARFMFIHPVNCAVEVELGDSNKGSWFPVTVQPPPYRTDIVDFVVGITCINHGKRVLLGCPDLLDDLHDSQKSVVAHLCASRDTLVVILCNAYTEQLLFISQEPAKKGQLPFTSLQLPGCLLLLISVSTGNNFDVPLPDARGFNHFSLLNLIIKIKMVDQQNMP
jgi:hypothetical protein